MDFRFDPETEAFRAEVRAFIAEHLTDEIIERAHTTGTMHDWGFHQALCERGLPGRRAGPPSSAGRAAAPSTRPLLMQELYAAGRPVDGLSIASMVAPPCSSAAPTPEGGRPPRILAGEVMCCLGYSEPDAGSDVAAVATKAVRDGDDWVIDGQKMFTTMAHEAHYVFLLTRTNTRRAQAQGPHDVPRADGHARHRDHARSTPWAASARTSPSTATCASPTPTGSARSTPAGR